MSYILEALRRAEAQRQQQSVPGLNDVSTAPGVRPAFGVPAMAPGESPDAMGGRPRRGLSLGIGLGLAGLVVAGLAVWAWPSRQAATPAAVIAHANAPTGAPVAPAAATPSPAIPPPVAKSPTDATAPAAVLLPPPGVIVASVPRPATMAAARRAAASAPAAVRPPPMRRPPQAPTPAPEPMAADGAVAVSPAPERAAAARAPAARPIEPLALLPADVRAGLPALSFGGSMYSTDASQRLVLINGEAVREGGSIAGARVEQIRPRSVVMRIGERRIEMPL